MILILILLLIGVGYLGLWGIGGMGVGSGSDQGQMNNTQNSDSQAGSDAAYLDESGVGNNSTSTERSGIVIDKDLLNRKMVIPTGEEKIEATTSKETTIIATTTATSTQAIKPVVASSTNSLETASSSPETLKNIDQISSSTEIISQ